jgi:hypothetical protein
MLTIPEKMFLLKASAKRRSIWEMMDFVESWDFILLVKKKTKTNPIKIYLIDFIYSFRYIFI